MPELAYFQALSSTKIGDGKSRRTGCGFDVAVHHLSGGVGKLSDYCGNSYFDDTYHVNNDPKSFEGYSDYM